MFSPNYDGPGGLSGRRLRRVERVSGDPRTDALLDDLERAALPDRLPLARMLLTAAGTAKAKFPFQFVPCRAATLLDRALAALSVDERSDVGKELAALFRYEERRCETAISDHRLAEAEARIRKVLAIAESPSDKS